MTSTWASELRTRKFQSTFILTLAFLGLVMSSFGSFLQWVEQRPGVVIPDPILALFSPIDLTWFAFTLIYGALVGAVVLLRNDPWRITQTVAAYGMMVTLRMVLMASLPLEPPPTMLTLSDPLVEFLSGASSSLTKDLFFSGHTSTLTLLTLAVPRGRWTVLFALATLGVATSVIAQHVHYAVDVFVAPLAAWAAWSVAERVFSRLQFKK